MDIVKKHNQKAFIFLLKTEVGFFGVAALQSATAFQIIDTKIFNEAELTELLSQKDSFASRGVQIVDLTSLEADEAASSFETYTSPALLLPGLVSGTPTYAYFQPTFSYFDISSFTEDVFLTTQKTRGPNR